MLKLNMKFIKLMNVKISTMVDILTFISMMNSTPESLNFIQYFKFYEQLNFHAHYECG